MLSSAAWYPVWQATYLPFGYEYNPQFTLNTRKFTGKERDAESGLDYFGARYYSSSIGRFMTPDWAAKPEAVPYSDLRDPQSLNLYGYVRNNPLSHADKDGHCYTFCTVPLGAVIGAAAGAGAEYLGEILSQEPVQSALRVRTRSDAPLKNRTHTQLGFNPHSAFARGVTTWITAKTTKKSVSIRTPRSHAE